MSEATIGNVPETVEGDAQRRVTLDGTAISFPVGAGESVLNAARRAGHWLPFECGWGSCGRCKATLVEGELASLFPQAPAIDARDERRRRHLLCQSTAVTDAVVKTLSVEGEPPAERPTADYVGTLVHVRELGPSVAEFRFSLTDERGAPAEARFLPGQYAVLEIDPGLRRCYSMANLPGTPLVDFVIKRYGGHLGSTRMFQLTPGALVPMELPYGDMWLRPTDRPVLMIAGGTGISAVLSLVRSLADGGAGIDRPVHVLYGATTRPDLVYWDELQRISEQRPALGLHGALLEADDAWPGHQGLVTAALESLLSGAIAADHRLGTADVYLAGPPAMVRAVHEVLNAAGLQLDRIHVDSFG